jgi:hypothetical protein
MQDIVFAAFRPELLQLPEFAHDRLRRHIFAL